MKKRIFSMLLALMLVLSVFVMSACNKDKASDDNDDDGRSESSATQSKIDVENATPEEIIQDSIDNVVNDVLPEYFTTTLETLTSGDLSNLTNSTNISDISDISLSAKAEINKLIIEGEDPFNGKSVKANAEAILDLDNYALQATVGLEYMGEKPSASAIINADGIYITDVLGALDKSIYYELPIGDYIAQIEDVWAQSSISEEDAQLIADIIIGAVEAIGTAIDNNITDAAYTTETKTVTVDSVEFKDATIVTLTLTPEIISGLATDIINNILDLEALQTYVTNMGGDFDAEALKSEFADELEYADFPTVKVISTISSDGDVARFEVVLSVEGEEEVFKVDILTVGDNFKLYVGITENGEFTNDYIAYEYTYDKSTKAEKLVFGIADLSERVDVLVAEGTYDGKTHEGTLTIAMDSENVSLKYALTMDDESFSLNIKDVSYTDGGVTVTVAIDLTIYGKATDTELTFGVEVKLDMKGTAEVDAAFEISCKVGDYTVTAPSSYTKLEDLTQEDMMNMLTDVPEKFPNIFSFVETLMDSYSGSGDSYYEEGTANNVIGF